MNVSELRRKLEERGVSRSEYRILEGYYPDALLLSKENGKWRVYMDERGTLPVDKWFDDEQQACAYFYKLMTPTP